MTLGVEGKKAKWALGALFAVLGWVVYSTFFSGPSTPSSATHVEAPPPVEDAADAAQTARAQIAAHAHDEFLPAVHRRGSKPLDPNTVDPTIHIELLAKLNAVPPAGGGRDLFSFGKPAPVLDKDEPIVKPKVEIIGPPVIKVAEKDPGPVKAGSAPAPPITFKYYGIVTTLANGKKRAFFMDGDEILIETEGVTFKGHYRLVRVNVGSAVVEDTQYKHEQTLPLAEDVQG